MEIERLSNPEIEEVVLLWHRVKPEAYPYLPLEQNRTLEEDREYFQDNILADCEIWVAKRKGEILGFLALQDDLIDRLYVKLGSQRGGVGAALMDHAKSLFPKGLRLFTHQKNASACSFYEKHGFTVLKYGVSPPPESEPDVEYIWEGDS